MLIRALFYVYFYEFSCKDLFWLSKERGYWDFLTYNKKRTSPCIIQQKNIMRLMNLKCSSLQSSEWIFRRSLLFLLLIITVNNYEFTFMSFIINSIVKVLFFLFYFILCIFYFYIFTFYVLRFSFKTIENKVMLNYEYKILLWAYPTCSSLYFTLCVFYVRNVTKNLLYCNHI